MTKGISDAHREEVYNTNVKIIALLHCRVLCCAKKRTDTHAVNIQVAFDRKWFSNIAYCSVESFFVNAANSVDDKHGYLKLLNTPALVFVHTALWISYDSHNRHRLLPKTAF